jgi:hypothetical protein
MAKPPRTAREALTRLRRRRDNLLRQLQEVGTEPEIVEAIMVDLAVQVEECKVAIAMERITELRLSKVEPLRKAG